MGLSDTTTTFVTRLQSVASRSLQSAARSAQMDPPIVLGSELVPASSARRPCTRIVSCRARDLRPRHSKYCCGTAAIAWHGIAATGKQTYSTAWLSTLNAAPESGLLPYTNQVWGGGGSRCTLADGFTKLRCIPVDPELAMYPSVPVGSRLTPSRRFHDCSNRPTAPPPPSSPTVCERVMCSQTQINLAPEEAQPVHTTETRQTMQLLARAHFVAIKSVIPWRPRFELLTINTVVVSSLFKAHIENQQTNTGLGRSNRKASTDITKHITRGRSPVIRCKLPESSS